MVQIIENAAKVGLRGLNYNFYVGEPARTANTPGRGGCQYSTFRIDEYDNDTLTDAGEVGGEEVFERIGYFVERVIPGSMLNKAFASTQFAQGSLIHQWLIDCWAATHTLLRGLLPTILYRVSGLQKKLPRP